MVRQESRLLWLAVMAAVWSLDYVQQVTSSTTPVVVTIPPEQLYPLDMEGVELGDQEHIVKGKLVENIQVYPWMVQLRMNYGGGRASACTGAVISDRFVLTASHCVVDKKTGQRTRDVTVRAGTVHTGHAPLNMVVDKVMVHPKYDYRDLQQGEGDDITLLRTKNKIPFSNTVRPVALPAHHRNYEGLKVNEMGWGLSQNKQPSAKLQYVDVQARNWDYCNAFYEHRFGAGVPSKTICAGGYGSGLCYGDSGGPLIYYSGSTPVAIGVSSLMPTTDCKNIDGPDVYTSTGFHVNWIRQNTREAPPRFV